MPTKSPNTEAMAESAAMDLLRQWCAGDRVLSLLYSPADGQAMLALRGTLVKITPALLEARGPSCLFTLNIQRTTFEYGPVDVFRPSLGLTESQDGLHLWTANQDWLFLAVASEALPGDGASLEAGE